ncbi:MAG: hypothetical protein R2852_04575 [Bacteroidia bacterium]
MYLNSINLFGTASNSSSSCLYNSSSSNLDIRNNIFSNPAGSYAFYSNNNPSISDYNNFYSSGSNLLNVNSSNYSTFSLGIC